MDHFIPVLLHPRPKRNYHIFIIDGAAQSVNAGYRRHNDHVIPLGKRRRRRMAQLIDLIVNRRVFFNVGIRGRNIRLGLIIVIVGDKILHRVLREKFLELGIKLGRQGFIVGNDQRRLVQRLDDVCHGKGLAGAGNAQQRFKLIPFLKALNQVGDGLRLVAGGGVFGY